MNYHFSVGDKTGDDSLIILDEDRLCYSVRLVSNGKASVRTISKVLLTEWGFLCNISDTQNLLAGRIDAVFYNEKEEIYTIADWKTGMSIPKNPIESPQALIYMYSFYKAQKDLKLLIKPEQIRFLFIQTPNLNESEIWFSEELKNKIEKDFISIIKNMKKTTFKKTDIKEECKFCEYNFVCKNY